ncbi:MAG: hypothetical protein ACYDCK_07440 [Thermoplasmatota archaeon]
MLRWSSPLSCDARSFAALVDASLSALGWPFEVSTVERSFDETVLFVAVPRKTAALRFALAPPRAGTLDVFDARAAPGAPMPRCEARGIDRATLSALLAEVARRAPRPPFRFTFAQRLALGFVRPEFREARRAWSTLGVH